MQLSRDRPWDEALARLRADGFSPIESIRITRAVLRVSLGEAKEIVHTSDAWASDRDRFEQLHDTAESVVRQL